MRYATVCSGIGAPELAIKRASLEWSCSFMSDIEAFPRAVLKHHYESHPLHGDFTTIQKDHYEPVDVLIGGTPCQSFSVAGKRLGLDDARGNLALEYLSLARRIGARWLVWENVPGVLSSNNGRDFGAFLGGLAECGYGFAYRVLDAQYFGVPQRRRRVILVGYSGNWRPAAAVLFERESLLRDLTPRREEGKGIAGTIGARTGRSIGAQDAANGHMIPETCGTLTADTHPGAYSGQDAYNDRLIPTYIAQLGHTKGNGLGVTKTDTANTLEAITGSNQAIANSSEMRVRRLTPTECERLMGFPDGYTDITFRKKPAADSNRYKALGNSMIVPKMQWILSRMDKVEKIMEGLR